MKKKVQQIKNLIQFVLTELMFRRFVKKVSADGIAIDCGANVGSITEKLAMTGAQVYAFEPNPYAFEKLLARVKNFKNVTSINKGVWYRNTTIPLYFHQMAEGDDAFWSFGSSIVKEKVNVDSARYVDVEIIDLIEFIEQLNKPIDLLKIDIEGAECELLEKFIEKGLHHKVKTTLVEVHDTKIEGQKVKTDRVRELIKKNNIKNINLNWL
jgi:FkbM family methyltransferase